MSQGRVFQRVLILVWRVGAIALWSQENSMKLLSLTYTIPQPVRNLFTSGTLCMFRELVLVLQPLLGCCDEHLRHLIRRGT